MSARARYALVGLLIAAGVGMFFLSGERVRDGSPTPTGASPPPPSPDVGKPAAAQPSVSNVSALPGGTFICGEPKAGETNLVSTYRYYPDGIYIELARTFSDRILTLTAIRLGTYEWSEGGVLTLRQSSASPNIEYGEPFAKTDILEQRTLTGDLAQGYAAKLTARTVGGQSHRVADVVQACTRNDGAANSIDKLREELRAHLPAGPAPAPAASTGTR